jgi:hypothetical protein
LAELLWLKDPRFAEAGKAGTALHAARSCVPGYEIRSTKRGQT